MRRVLALPILLIAFVAAAQNIQLRTRVDVVVVPVSVKDEDGKLVAGLTKNTFTVLEDARQQEISNFSAEPQPLSAAIIIDTGMGGIAMRRLVPLFISVTGGFSEFDEMSAFRYDHLVHKLCDFTSDPIQIEKSFEIVKTIAEKQPAQVPAGSPAPTAPKIIQLLLGALGGGSSGGGPPPDPTKPPTTQRPPSRGSVPSSRVLYDAVYEAAKALEERPPNHRKIIFIISDGQVGGQNTHNLDDTTTLLLRNEIQLYAVLTDYGAFEGKFGVLNSFAQATGGDTYRGLTTAAMEAAFSRITEQARNQYVLGYHSNNLITNGLPVIRTTEVKAENSRWKLTHRKGYVQAP